MKLILNTLTALAISLSFASAEDAKPAKPADGKPQMSPEDAFKKMDKDSDSSVTLEEFKASPRGKKDPAKAEEVFKKMDKDSNGKLSLEEFKAHGPKPGKGGKKGDQPDAPKPEAQKPEAPKPEAK
jgi:hypothetical protein